MEQVTLFAAIGPNPAPVSEAIWALYRQRGWCVVAAHLVMLERGFTYLEREFLLPGGALDQLRDVLPGILDRDAIRTTVATAPSGRRISSAEEAQYVDQHRDAVWTSAVSCVGSAAQRPVAFLLAGGRLRTTTAYAATVFQLLARDQDLLLDVRVSDRRVEGGSGFFFPEQKYQSLSIQGELVVAGEVDVHLVEVPVPRLRRLVPQEALASFEGALASSQGLMEALAPPAVRIDLSTGQAFVGDLPLKLSDSRLLWFAALALQRIRDPEGDGWLDTYDTPRVAELLDGATKAYWPDYKAEGADLWKVLTGEANPDQKEGRRLAKLRTDTRKAIEKWCRDAGRPAWAAWLVPAFQKTYGGGRQRLPLPPQQLEIVPFKPGR